MVINSEHKKKYNIEQYHTNRKGNWDSLEFSRV